MRARFPVLVKASALKKGSIAYISLNSKGFHTVESFHFKQIELFPLLELLPSLLVLLIIPLPNVYNYICVCIVPPKL